MSGVHQHVYQSKGLVFVDALSSFEDFNNPLFVMSISSAAGGLPLGIVTTSAESADVIHKGMTTLTELFPESSLYGNGYPTNIMIDDSSVEREGYIKLGQPLISSHAHFIFYRVCGDGFCAVRII